MSICTILDDGREEEVVQVKLKPSTSKESTSVEATLSHYEAGMFADVRLMMRWWCAR